MKKSLLFFASIALSCSAHAATYYVSDCGSGASAQCVAGSDSNSGTSAGSPWKSCAKVSERFPSMMAGDRILFAQGAAIPACQLYYLSNLNSRRENPITIGAYVPPWATGVQALPILRGTADSYTLGLLNSGDSSHDEGYVVQDLHFVGLGTAATQFAIALGNDVDYVTIQRVEIEQYRGGIQCDGGTNHAQRAGSDGLSEHMVIRDSSIHHNRGIGILTSCDDTLIENNHFDSNGVGMLDHHIYVDDAALNNVALSTSQVVIRGNTLLNNAPYASTSATTPSPGICGAVAIVVHGLKDGITIENNVLSEQTVPRSGSCWGISVDSGGYGGIYAKEGFRNIVIAGNSVVNYAMGIGLDLCDSCTVENNSIYSEFPAGANGIVAPSKYFLAHILGNTLNTHLTVRNNSIFLKNPTRASVGIHVGRDGVNHTVVSNLIYFGSGTTATTACFDTTGLTASAFDAFDNNLCYFSSGLGAWDTLRTTLATQRAAGLDLNSLAANPSLDTPVAPLYLLTPTRGSPALGAGQPTLSSRFAQGGLKRNPDAPDIGAAQLDATIVVPNPPTGLKIQ